MEFSTFSAIFVVAAVTVVVILVNVLRNAGSLRAFDGPGLARFSRLWLLNALRSGKSPNLYTKVNERYGPTACIGPSLLLTRDPDLIIRVNAMKSAYTRSIFYTAVRFHPTRESIVSHRDEEIHSKVRAQMTSGYSGRENACLEQDIDQEISSFLRLIRSKYLSTPGKYQPFDLARKVTFFTLDAISKVAFGQSFGFLDKDEDIFGYIKQIRQMLPILMFFTVYPELRVIMDLSQLPRLAPKAFAPASLGKIMSFAEAAVKERFGEEAIVRRDMLGSFIKHGMSQEVLESETLTQISAGSDSTATALRATLFLIATHPIAYGELVRELLATLRAGRLTRPVLKDSEARQLPFLQACIQEGLRLCPPITALLFKDVPAGGDTIDGKHVPAGTQIGFNFYGAMRDKAVFGLDADLFRPERWLPNGGRSDAELTRMREVHPLIFGSGRFGCLGRNVARMELGKVIAEFFLRFNIQVANPGKPFSEMACGFYFHDDMFVRVEERSQGAAEAALVWGTEL